MNREEAEDRGYSPDEMYDDPPVERALAFGDLTQKEQSVYQCDLAKAHEWLEGLLDESDPLILVTKMVGRVTDIGEYLLAVAEELESLLESEDLASEALTVGERNPTLAQESRRG